MDISKLKPEDIFSLIKILHDLLDGKYGELTEENKRVIIEKLRELKLDYLLNNND